MRGNRSKSSDSDPQKTFSCDSKGGKNRARVAAHTLIEGMPSAPLTFSFLKLLFDNRSFVVHPATSPLIYQVTRQVILLKTPWKNISDYPVIQLKRKYQEDRRVKCLRDTKANDVRAVVRRMCLLLNRHPVFSSTPPGRDVTGFKTELNSFVRRQRNRSDWARLVQNHRSQTQLLHRLIINSALKELDFEYLLDAYKELVIRFLVPFLSEVPCIQRAEAMTQPEVEQVFARESFKARTPRLGHVFFDIFKIVRAHHEVALRCGSEELASGFFDFYKRVHELSREFGSVKEEPDLDPHVAKLKKILDEFQGWLGEIDRRLKMEETRPALFGALLGEETFEPMIKGSSFGHATDDFSDSQSCYDEEDFLIRLNNEEEHWKGEGEQECASLGPRRSLSLFDSEMKTG